jgi:predicted nucleotidyltransferase
MEPKLQSEIINFLMKKIAPKLIYIFGSTIKGTSNKHSDIDIAFLTNQNLDEYQTFMLAQELAGILNKDVDLIDINKASTVFQGQIVSTGKVIYCLDEKIRMDYEMKTLKMYAKLNEERQNIIDSIQKRGAVYNEE